VKLKQKTLYSTKSVSFVKKKSGREIVKIIREEVHQKMVKNRQKESALDQTADSSYDYKEDKISP